jgi:recombination protein RecA
MPTTTTHHPAREVALAAAVQRAERLYGTGALRRLRNDQPPTPIPVIPTGSLALDHALGIGGVPRGRVTEVFGPEAAGKTTLALSVVAQAHAAGGLAAVVDVEHALDPAWASRLGVDLDRLVLAQPDTGEQALELVDILARSAAVDAIAVDSAASLVPRAEVEGEMGDSYAGLQARLIAQALRKLAAPLAKTQTALIFCNQLRQNVGTLFGNPEFAPGGRALKFHASLRLDVRRVQAIKDGPEVVGARTRVKVVKNKLAAPYRTAEFDLSYTRGIDATAELVEIGADLGLLTKAGPALTFARTPLGHGCAQAAKHLRNHPDLAAQLDREIRTRLAQPAALAS